MRSSLETYELATGRCSVVRFSDDLVEAPNWTPDGDSLVINGDGRLFRVALDEPAALEPIDTGMARKCNNDHGVSPDGALIALSDSTETGKPCIYLVPSGGGTPKRVTRNVPSWWHGWSPDGARLAYTAARDGSFFICTIPVEGGEEDRLVGGDGAHYDGPDYTPDGAWVWFNSDRSGSMQLWRVRSDGSGLEQMTDDERANWFPHPSPDGGNLLYLAYEAGTQGHPRDRDVELRLIDLETGERRTLLSVFGGQGTINVPCWSPDGDRFAFMRYHRTH